jgi:hypothetical protein
VKEMHKYRKTTSTSHAKLRDIAVKELIKEGYSPSMIQFDVQIDSKRVDIVALGEMQTTIECKSFKHTNDYTSHLKTTSTGRKILCQPFFDVDEMWLVYKTKKNKYIVIKVPRPKVE